MFKTLDPKFREVLIEKKTFYLVFGGFYNLLITNYRYQGANCVESVVETRTKLLQLLKLFPLALRISSARRLFMSLCIRKKGSWLLHGCQNC